MAKKSVVKTGNVTADIVAKLWNLCNILRDDGITYTEYVTELTYLFFFENVCFVMGNQTEKCSQNGSRA